MRWSKWIRQAHRWLSMAFTAVVLVLFAMLGAGLEPAQWAYFLPLFPLALLMLSGLYLFVLPYAAGRRGGPSAGEGS